MTLFLPFASSPGAAAAPSTLVTIAPAAIALAVVLVLLTVLCTIALIREVLRDGYGLERPRAVSEEFPWQVAWAPRRRAARPWGTRRLAGVGRR